MTRRLVLALVAALPLACSGQKEPDPRLDEDPAVLADPARFDRHAGDLRQAGKVDRLARLYHVRSILRSDQNDHRGAVADLSEAVQLQPDDAGYRALRSYQWQALNDHAQAVADANKAVELAPKDATNWIARGYAHQAAGKKAEARADFEQAKAIDPSTRIPPSLNDP